MQPSSASLLPDPSLSRRRRRSINSAKRCRVFEEIASTLPTILTSSARKKYVESILNGPRADISGPLGVMMVRDLVGTMGLYQISSMVVALDETPLPAGTKPYFH